MAHSLRTFGDPVLKSAAAPITDVDGKLIRLVDDMFDTLVDSGNGIALAAPQIGVKKQVVDWDIDENPLAIVNPEIVESDGEWVYDEGCLSIPGLYVEMLRPKTVLMRGSDIDGEVVELEADELEEFGVSSVSVRASFEGGVIAMNRPVELFYERQYARHRSEALDLDRKSVV